MKKTLFACLCLSVAISSAHAAPTPEELGWEAGVVAPSPLKPVWEGKALSNLTIAEKAKAEAEAELQRVSKLRQAHYALCNKKFFVNSCIGKAEEVLKDREHYAAQLKRTADNRVRQYKWEERKKKPVVDPVKPAKRANPASVTNEELKERGLKATERARQEAANEKAYEAKLQEAQERRARLEKEAEKRKKQREARRAQYEKQRAAQERAQAYQESTQTQQQKSIF